LPTTWSRKNIRPQYRRRLSGAAADQSATYNPAVRARVFAPDAEATGQSITLAADESAHLGRVLRLTVGDAVRVFDGRGHEWAATIQSGGGARVTVTLTGVVAPAVESLVRYVVAPAVLKGDATDDVIRDAVMLGAAQVRPFVATRSEVRLATLARAGRDGRWARIAVAAAKQCGRAVVPPVDAAVAFDTLVTGVDTALRLLLVEPGLAGAATSLRAIARPSAVTLAIGPEGGWTADEMALAASHGWTAVRLGGRTVRAASMALVALAACQAVWDDGEPSPSEE
jgi:16S rRNA (uracil1498-N3)-methyltransferase